MAAKPTPYLMCYDDARARAFEPFSLSRPWSEMRVGAALVRERWVWATAHRARAFLAGPHMRNFREPGSPGDARGRIRAGALIVNSRCAVSLNAVASDAVVYRCDGRVAAVRLRTDMSAADFADGSLTLETVARAHHGRTKGVVVEGAWCDNVWDVIRHLQPLLLADLPILAAALGANARLLAGEFVLGTHAVTVAQRAEVEPLVVFDASAGPILVSDGARVQAFSRVVGPCFIGPHSTVSGGKVSGSAIGDSCKVNGEMSATVLVGHANKGHDGFVGHSVLGRWVNLGAGTTTSNLKNTYGPIALWTPEGVRDTGLQFLGTLFGDHVKTGIGLRLTTGCVLGAGANVVDRMPPKVVAPFAWGSGAPYGVYDQEKFLETAERVMSRRAVSLDEGMRRHLASAHGRRWITD